MMATACRLKTPDDFSLIKTKPTSPATFLVPPSAFELTDNSRMQLYSPHAFTAVSSPETAPKLPAPFPIKAPDAAGPNQSQFSSSTSHLDSHPASQKRLQDVNSHRTTHAIDYTKLVAGMSQKLESHKHQAHQEKQRLLDQIWGLQVHELDLIIRLGRVEVENRFLKSQNNFLATHPPQ
jgi:hypothetical protein